MKRILITTVIAVVMFSGCTLPDRYVVTEATGFLSPGEAFSIFAEYGPGDEVFAGGWLSRPAPEGSADVALTRNQPAFGPPNNPTSWFVEGTNTAPNSTRVTVFANCWDLNSAE